MLPYLVKQGVDVFLLRALDDLQIHWLSALQARKSLHHNFVTQSGRAALARHSALQVQGLAERKGMCLPG